MPSDNSLEDTAGLEGPSAQLEHGIRRPFGQNLLPGHSLQKKNKTKNRKDVGILHQFATKANVNTILRFWSWPGSSLLRL